MTEDVRFKVVRIKASIGMFVTLVSTAIVFFLPTFTKASLTIFLVWNWNVSLYVHIV